MFTPSPTPSQRSLPLRKGSQSFFSNDAYPSIITYLECSALLDKMDDISIVEQFISKISSILSPKRLAKIILFHTFATRTYNPSGPDLTFMKQTLLDLAQTKLENENVDNKVTDEDTLNISSMPTDILSYCLRFLYKDELEQSKYVCINFALSSFMTDQFEQIEIIDTNQILQFGVDDRLNFNEFASVNFYKPSTKWIEVFADLAAKMQISQSDLLIFDASQRMRQIDKEQWSMLYVSNEARLVGVDKKKCLFINNKQIMKQERKKQELFLLRQFDVFAEKWVDMRLCIIDKRMDSEMMQQKVYDQFYSKMSDLNKYFHDVSNDDIFEHDINERKIAMERDGTGRIIIGSVNLEHSLLRSEFLDHHRSTHHILSQTKIMRIFAFDSKEEAMTKFNIIYDSHSTVPRNSSSDKEMVSTNLQTLDRRWRVYRYPFVDDIVKLIQTRIFNNLLPTEAIEILSIGSKQKLTVIHRDRGNRLFENDVFYRIVLFTSGR